MSIYNIEFGGKTFTVEATTQHEIDFWNLYTTGKWEQEYLRYMTENINGKIFLDIGSWIGPVSLLMAKYYERVLAIDLDPVANEKFKKNLLLNKIENVTLFELGFSDKEGKLSISGDNLGKSVTSIYGDTLGKKVEVNVVRFDEFVAALTDVGNIGFIKIDCEGAEYKFLHQLYRFVKGKNINVLISYHPFVLKKPGYYFIKFRHWLAQLPFKRLYFTNTGQIISKKPYEIVFKLTDRFPMADVLIGK